MRQEKKNIEELLRKHIPSPSTAEMESDGARVLGRLKEYRDRGDGIQFESGQLVVHRPSSWTFPRIGAIATAAALVAISIVLAPFLKALIAPNKVYAIVETVQGSVYQVAPDGKTRAVAVGQKIDVGIALRTESNAAAVLKLPDGAVIEVHGQSEVSLENAHDGLHILLNDGSVSVTPARQPGQNLFVQNKEVTVPVTTAIFQSVRAAESAPPAQTIETPDSFIEVSIRPSSPPPRGGGRGGGGASGLGPLTPCLRIGVQLEPGRFIAVHASVYDLIAVANGIRCPGVDSISGAPEWIRTEAFDIQAVIPGGRPVYTKQQLAEGKAPRLQRMLQHLLVNRFNLALHHDTREMAAYNLVVIDPNKLKLSEDQTGATRAAPPVHESLALYVGSSTMAMYADLLQSQLGRVVVDKTSLKGLYDFDLPLPELAAPVDPAIPGGDVRRQASERIVELLPIKLQEYLGLNLEPVKISVETLVIERVESPNTN